MTALNASSAKRITADWVSVFPDFDVYRPLWLMRRMGPVVQGIILDRTRSGDEYVPTSHVHALTHDFPTISLMLNQRSDRVKVIHHERDYLSAAAKLRDQSVLSLADSSTIDAIIAAYHSVAITQQQKGYPPAVQEMEDSILISAATDRLELLHASLALASELATVWPKSRLPLDWSGAEEWLGGLQEKAADRRQLESLVNDQINKHKLGSVRAS